MITAIVDKTRLTFDADGHLVTTPGTFSSILPPKSDKTDEIGISGFRCVRERERERESVAPPTMLVRFRARVATRLRMTTPSAAFLSSAVGNLLLTSSSVAPATEARTRALSSFLSKAEKGGEKVRLCEVGPRDGLQNETTIVDASVKLELIDRLVKAGLRTIESAAFVSPKWVPQMANSAEVMRSLQGKPHFVSGSVSFPALVPNLKGMDAAIASGTKEIAIFASASESFSRKNINCTIEESLVRFKPVLESAKVNGIKVRG